MRKRLPSKKREIYCKLCGNSFMSSHSQAKYCFLECKNVGKRISWNKYSERNREARRKHGQLMYQNNIVNVSKRVKKYKSTKKGKEVQKAADIKQRSLYPEKYNARMQVLMAKRKGILKQESCSDCGVEKTEAHHEDYFKPLEVIWLCKKCHDKITFYKKVQ